MAIIDNSSVVLKATGNPNLDTPALWTILNSQPRLVRIEGPYPLALNQTIRLTRNGQRIVGLGQQATEVIWYGPVGAVNVFLMEDIQDAAIECMTIRTATGGLYLGGSAIALRNAFLCRLRDLRFDRVWNAIDISHSTETSIDHVVLRSLYGTAGVTFRGAEVDGERRKSFRLTIDRLLADEGEYQNPDINWIVFDSLADTLVVSRTNLLNGARGLWMRNSLGGADAAPHWLEAIHLETDHCRLAGVALDGGQGAQITAPWIGSTKEGPGLVAKGEWQGGLHLSDARVHANAEDGIAILAGRVNTISGGQFGDNGMKKMDPGAGARMACEDWSITGGYYGDVPWTNGNGQDVGILIEPTAIRQRYSINGPVIRGNRLAAVMDMSSRAHLARHLPPIGRLLGVTASWST